MTKNGIFAITIQKVAKKFESLLSNSAQHATVLLLYSMRMVLD